MRRAFIVLAVLVAACGAKQQVVKEPEREVNSCEDALASVRKLPRKSDATCMRVLKMTRVPPPVDGRVLVLGKLKPGPILDDPGGGKEAKPVKVRRDGAFHDECPGPGTFVEVEGKMSESSGLVEARIVRVHDDWHESSCADDEGPPPPPPPVAAPPFDKAAAISAIAAAEGPMKKKCKAEGVPTSKCHYKVVFMSDGTAGTVEVDAPPFAGTKTAKCVEETLKAALKIAPFTGDAVTLGRDFTL